jgi:hypothetical protein
LDARGSAWLSSSADVPGRIDDVVSEGGLRQQQVAGAGRPQVTTVGFSDGGNGADAADSTDIADLTAPM